MQIKINGEQPFQVLGTNFTIGPSSSGYDLYFSADGRSYSKLFTVGANTNRQVTQVAAGSYYLLSGNTSEVTVNWMKDCGGSVISSEGSEAFKVNISTIAQSDWTSDDYSALKKMAEYLSGKAEMVEAYIDVVSGLETDSIRETERLTLNILSSEYAVFFEVLGNSFIQLGINLEDVEQSLVEEYELGGGSGNQNYVIVEQLSDITDPVEGMLAYVKFKRLNGWALDAKQITEGYVAKVYYDGSNYSTIYKSDTDFYWGWKNSTTDWIFEQNIWYKIDRENGIFYAACEDPNAYVTVEDGVTSASTIAEIEIKQLYLYNGTAWEMKNFPPKDIYFEQMSDAERMGLYDNIIDLLGGNSGSGNLPKLFSKYRFFTAAGEIDGQNTSEVFFSNFEGSNIWFVGSKMSKMSYPVDIYRVVVTLKPDGSIEKNVSSFRDSLNS